MNRDEPQWLVRSPGRVNLIGEHTDYNDGFVLPLAIDLELRLTFRRRPDRRIVLQSSQAAKVLNISPDDDETPAGWGAYVFGVAKLLDAGGIEGAISSDVPAGAGLSSSAALELAIARALQTNEWDAAAMAKLCQRAENEYAGNRCGIMDQLAVACGKAGHALFVDCRSLAMRHVPLPQTVAVVVCDSAKPRQLVNSAYNDRRAACEEAARALGVPALRDASRGLLEHTQLDPTVAKRARHVVDENERVLQAVEALAAGDLARVGQLLYDSHASLRDLFEVSSPELDLLVELARRQPGCIGSRLTGAGFGGCTVSLVQREAAAGFAGAVVTEYRQRTGLPGRSWVCQAVDGVSIQAA